MQYFERAFALIFNQSERHVWIQQYLDQMNLLLGSPEEHYFLNNKTTKIRFILPEGTDDIFLQRAYSIDAKSGKKITTDYFYQESSPEAVFQIKFTQDGGNIKTQHQTAEYSLSEALQFLIKDALEPAKESGVIVDDISRKYIDGTWHLAKNEALEESEVKVKKRSHWSIDYFLKIGLITASDYIDFIEYLIGITNVSDWEKEGSEVKITVNLPGDSVTKQVLSLIILIIRFNAQETHLNTLSRLAQIKQNDFTNQSFRSDFSITLDKVGTVKEDYNLAKTGLQITETLKLATSFESAEVSVDGQSMFRVINGSWKPIES